MSTGTRVPFAAIAIVFMSPGGCALWGSTDFACWELGTCAAAADGGQDATLHISDATREREPSDAGPIDVSSADHAVADAQGEHAADDAGVADVSSDGAPDSAPACDSTRPPDEEPCVIDDGYAIFVAPGPDGTAGEGTRSLPFIHLAPALQAAKVQKKRIYICDDGRGYSEPIVINEGLDGLQVWGGFECSGWRYGTTRARLTAPVSPVLRITRLSTGLLLADVDVIAPDGASAGDSSVAAIVHESHAVVFRRAKLTAGRGKDGVSGDNGGGSSNEAAASGAAGNPGAKACTASPNPGGSSATAVCGGVVVGAGGEGGKGSTPPISMSGGDGADGTPLYTAGKRGVGEPATGVWDCSTGRGQDGSNGSEGTPGRNAAGLGTLSASSGWVADPASDGIPGVPGQGGGGGGGAKAPLACSSLDGGSAPSSGASGGSGGGGGCGGKGGKAGTAGGSSIALVTIDSDLSLDRCELTASDGGKGGNGGQGQGGGSGGSPGSGGLGAGNPLSNPGCDGGKGGKGGNGGPGGGASGGHSIGVAYRGAAPAGLELSSIQVALKGGPGGKSGSELGGTGADGNSRQSQSFAPTADAGK